MTEEFRQEIFRQELAALWKIKMDAFRAIMLTHQSLQAIAQQVAAERRASAGRRPLFIQDYSLLRPHLEQ